MGSSPASPVSQTLLPQGFAAVWSWPWVAASARIKAKSGQPLVNPDPVNQSLRQRGVRLTIERLKDSLWLRGTLPTLDGAKKRQRLSLGLKATPAGLLEAEARAVALAAAVTAGTYPACGLPWAKPADLVDASNDSPPLAPHSVAHWVERFEEAFWMGRIRTSAAERTWDRIVTELRRLPPKASLTTELLAAVVRGTKPGSRTRLEACKVYKRLGRLAGLDGLEHLDALRTPYEPTRRELPGDEELFELLQLLRSDNRWGWATAALAAYGCRPAEVFSLQPASDGTARVLTVKRKGKLPSWRTAMALPPDWMAVLDLQRVERVWDCACPANYDSATGKRLVERWGRWLARRSPGMQLYDIRHAWAVRTIRLGLNASLAAKCMGHSLAVHHETYHRWLDQADVAAVARQLFG